MVIVQCPVVQSIVSLTKSLVEESGELSLTVLTKSLAVIFFVKNCEELLHCKRFSHFFGKKNGRVFVYNTFGILMFH